MEGALIGWIKTPGAAAAVNRPRPSVNGISLILEPGAVHILEVGKRLITLASSTIAMPKKLLVW